MTEKMSLGKVIALTLCVCVFVDSISGECNVVDKKDWGGLEPTSVVYLPRPVDLVIIQHTVSASCMTDAACKGVLQGIQEYHMDSLGFWDIGSSFYVGGNSKVYKGTGWLHRGAHTYGYNSRSIGISFIGNFNEDGPSDKMLRAVKDLLKCGVAEGHLTASYRVVAHRQLIATISPGKYLYSKIRTWPEWVEDVTDIKNGH